MENQSCVGLGPKVWVGSKIEEFGVSDRVKIIFWKGRVPSVGTYMDQELDMILYRVGMFGIWIRLFLEIKL